MDKQPSVRTRRKPTPKGGSSSKMSVVWQKTKEGIKKFRTEWNILFNLLIVVAIFFSVIGICSVAMNIFTRHGSHLIVPDYLGINVKQASVAAKNSDLEIIISDSLYIPGYEGGIIVDQLPKGGAKVKSGRKVYVTINSFTQKMVRVPYVAGRSLRQAKNMLEIAGLGIEKLVYEPDLATNYVLAEIADGITMKSGSNIEIPVGSGVVLKVGVSPSADATIVPKVIGCSLREAKSRLWEQGLNVGKITFDEGINKLSEKDAKVYQQSIGHNVETRLGREVDMHLTLDMTKVGDSSSKSDMSAKELENKRIKEIEENKENDAHYEDNSAIYISTPDSEPVLAESVSAEPVVESTTESVTNAAIVDALQQSSDAVEIVESDKDEFF